MRITCKCGNEVNSYYNLSTRSFDVPNHYTYKYLFTCRKCNSEIEHECNRLDGTTETTFKQLEID